MTDAKLIDQKLKELGVTPRGHQVGILKFLLSDSENVLAAWSTQDGFLFATPLRLICVKGVYKKEYISIPWGNLRKLETSIRHLRATQIAISLSDGEIINVKGTNWFAKPNLEYFTEKIPAFLSKGKFTEHEITRGKISELKSTTSPALTLEDSAKPDLGSGASTSPKVSEVVPAEQPDQSKLGFFKRRKQEKILAKQHALHVKRVDELQRQIEVTKGFIDIAQKFKGEDTSDLLLKKDEKLFFYVQNSSLVEIRSSSGKYSGKSAGVSIPIGHIGRYPVRYRVGVSQGNFTQATPQPQAVDVGTTYITNQRVVFEGNRQTRECSFSKLVGFRHDSDGGSTTFSVSNRQKPVTIHYGMDVLPLFVFRLELALSYFRENTDELVSQLQHTLDELESSLQAESESA